MLSLTNCHNWNCRTFPKKTFYHRHQEWIGCSLSLSFTGLRSVSMFCCTADECCQLMRRPLLSARRSDPDWAPETLLIRGKGSPVTPLLHLERGLGRPGRHCGRPAGKGREGQYYDTGKSPQHAQGSIEWWEGGGSRGLQVGASSKAFPTIGPPPPSIVRMAYFSQSCRL